MAATGRATLAPERTGIRSRRSHGQGYSNQSGAFSEEDEPDGQPQRVNKIQKRWQSISEDLPPQLARRHIGMISVGGVIGTGLFLGSADALHYGGPAGAFLGYSIIGTVIYCLCVSIGEMIAFLPNVGGVVGIADLYVDPALGFSMGWFAWYHWSVILPSELTAAAIVMQNWKPNLSHPAISAIFFIAALVVNCFSSRVYGEIEFWLSLAKCAIIIAIIILSLLIDIGALGKKEHIGVKYWNPPYGPFAPDYLGIKGSQGRFLGFAAVLMQATFSYIGSEVPGIAAGEVIDATRNVPRALRRVWIRITLFYVIGVLAVGFVVPNTHLGITKYKSEAQVKAAVDSPDDPNNCGQTTYSSPFAVAFECAGIPALAQFINAAILISALSAATSDIYISSRYLFFLARCKHAPQIFAFLIKYNPFDPRTPSPPVAEHSPSPTSEDIPMAQLNTQEYTNENQVAAVDDDSEHSYPFPVPAFPVPAEVEQDAATPTTPTTPAQRKPWIVLPLWAVLGSASIGLLSLVSQASFSSEIVFGWLVAVTSVAAIQSWLCMMLVYIRWHRGTVYAERRLLDPSDADAKPWKLKVRKQIAKIKENRHWGQPFLAYYAFTMCAVILLANGLAVFIHNGWKIAETSNPTPPSNSTQSSNSTQISNSTQPSNSTQTSMEGGTHIPNPALAFLAAYVPIPVFVLLTLGYKLIYQTKLVRIEDMEFDRGNVDDAQQQDPPANGIWNRFLQWLLVR